MARAKRHYIPGYVWHMEAGEGYQVREKLSSYSALFGVKNADIDPKNTYLWNVKQK